MSVPAGDCLRVRTFLGDLVDGGLPPALEREVQEHLHLCRDCARRLSELEYVDLRLKECLAPVEPPLGFTAEVMARVRAEAPPGLEEDFTERVMARVRAEALPARRLPRPLLVGAGLAAAGLAAVLVLRSPAPAPAGQGAQSAAGRTWWVVAWDGELEADGLTLGGGRGAPGRRGGGTVLASGAGGAAQPVRIAGEGRLGWGPGARAALELREGERRSLRLSGTGPVRLAAGAGGLSLLAGSVLLERLEEAARGAPALGLPTGGAYLLEQGRAEVAVVRLSGLAPESGPAGLGIRVHQLEGTGRLRESPGAEAVELRAGTLALLDPLRPLRLVDLTAAATAARPGRVAEPARGLFVLRGLLRGREGRPQPQALVHLDLGGPAARSTRSDAAGRFAFELPWPGGRIFGARIWAAGEGGLYAERVLEPLAGPQVLELDLSLARPWVGRLVDAYGRPVPGALLRLLRRDPYLGVAVRAGIPDVQTDRSGAFRLPRPASADPFGEWLLVIAPPGAPAELRRAPRLAGLFAAGGGGRLLLELGSAEERTLEPASPKSRRLWLAEELRLAGTLLFRRLRAVPGPAGAARRVLVPAGSRRLRWWEDGGGDGPQLYCAGELHGGTFRAPPPESLELRLLGRDGRPLAGAPWRLVAGGGGTAAGRADGAGRIRLRLRAPRGAFRCFVRDAEGLWRAFDLPPAGAVALIRAEDGKLARPGEAGAELPPAPRALALPPGTKTCRIELRGPGGAPAGGARLVLGVPGRGLWPAGRAGPDGRVDVPVAGAGWRLKAAAPDLGLGRAVLPAAGGSLPLNLAPLGTVDLASFGRLLGRGASLRLEVLDGPFAGVVLACPSAGAGRLRVPAGRLRLRAGSERLDLRLAPGALLRAPARARRAR